MIDRQTKAILSELLNFSTHKKHKLFVVGGTLRDHLLSKNIGDIDLTGINAAVLGIQFSKFLNFSHVPLDKTPGRATTRIILPQQQHFDLTDMQGDCIEEDLLKRDFTINAMGQDLSDFLINRKSIIDLCEGKEDLNQNLIRVTSTDAFKSDPLRMLRAFRFAATLSFSIDPETLKGISLFKENITSTAGERVWAELVSLFKADNTWELINLMKRSGLFYSIFPNSFQDWEKVLAQYRRLEHLIANPVKYFPSHTPILKGATLLKLSMLLKELEANPLIDNIEKNDYGIPKTFEILKGLKASNSEIRFICKSIQSLHFLSTSLSCSKNDSSLYDLCAKGGEQLVAGTLLHACTLPFPDEPGTIESEKLNLHSKLLEFYFTRYLPVTNEKPLLNGNDIITIFNVSPSPTVGEILKKIHRAQVLGDIKTSAEAEELAANILNSKTKN